MQLLVFLSLVFADYGAREWLKAGFVVDTNDEMSRKLQYLIDNPNALVKVHYRVKSLLTTIVGNN